MSEHIISISYNVISKKAVVMVQIVDKESQTCTFETRTWPGNQVVKQPDIIDVDEDGEFIRLSAIQRIIAGVKDGSIETHPIGELWHKLYED